LYSQKKLVFERETSAGKETPFRSPRSEGEVKGGGEERGSGCYETFVWGERAGTGREIGL